MNSSSSQEIQDREEEQLEYLVSNSLDSLRTAILSNQLTLSLHIRLWFGQDIWIWRNFIPVHRVIAAKFSDVIS